MFVIWGNKRLLAEESDGEAPLNSSLVLAARRTHRRDPIDDFKKYSGGWNISEKHYWAVSKFPSVYLSFLLIILLKNRRI